MVRWPGGAGGTGEAGPSREPVAPLPPGDHPELRADVIVLHTRWRPVTVTVAVALAGASAVHPVAGGIFFPVMFLVAAWTQYRFRTELRRNVAFLDSGLRRREVPWQRVGDVVIVRAPFGVRRVALVTAAGLVPLPVPVLHRFSSEQQFARQAGLVRSWWDARLR